MSKPKLATWVDAGTIEHEWLTSPSPWHMFHALRFWNVQFREARWAFLARAIAFPLSLTDAIVTPGIVRETWTDTNQDWVRSWVSRQDRFRTNENYHRACNLFREVLGNPWRCHIVAEIPPTQIQYLVCGAMESLDLDTNHLDPVSLAILADALEERGGYDPALLAHLRGQGDLFYGYHGPGCWALAHLMGMDHVETS